MLNEIFKNSLFTTISKIISLTLGFASSIFFIRLLGAEGKGHLSILEASSALIVLVSSLNLNVSIIQFVSKAKINKDKILGLSIIIFIFSIILSIIILTVLYLLESTMVILPNSNIIVYAGLLLLMIIVIELKEIFSSFLKGLKFFKDLYYSTLIYSIFRLFLFLILYVVHMNYNINFSVIQLIFAHILCLIVLMLSTFVFFIREVKIVPSFKISFLELKPFLRYSSVGLVVILISFLGRKSDIWIISYLLDTRELGYYAVAVTLGDLVLQIPMTLKNVLFPYLSSSKSSFERKKLLAMFSRFNATIILMIISFLIISSHILIPFMYGKEFVNSIVPFQIFIIGIGFIGFKEFFQIYNMSIEKQNVNIWSNMLGLFLLVSLNFILIPLYGIKGASLAAMLSFAVSTIFIYYRMTYLKILPHQNYFFITLSDFKKIMIFLKSRIKS